MWSLQLRHIFHSFVLENCVFVLILCQLHFPEFLHVQLITYLETKKGWVLQSASIHDLASHRRFFGYTFALLDDFLQSPRLCRDRIYGVLQSGPEVVEYLDFAAVPVVVGWQIELQGPFF